MNKVMILLIVIIGFVILTIGLYYAFTSFKPLHFNLLAGLMALIIGAFALFGKHKQDKYSSEKSDKILQSEQITIGKIDSLELQNAELTLSLEKQSETIDNLRRENTDLHSRLSKVSHEIYSKVTGGNSYCVVTVMFSDIEKPKYLIRLLGNIALKNINISIDDIGRRQYLLENIKNIDNNPDEIFQAFNKTKYVITTSLYPETARILEIPMEKDQKDIDLLITIYQDNGTTEQLLKIPNFRSKDRKPIISIMKNGVSLPLH